jgi:hypothetical protein
MNHACREHIADALADMICKRVGIAHEVWFAVLFKALAPWERQYQTMLHGVWDKERRVMIANLRKLNPKAYAAKGDSLIDSILYPKGRFVELLGEETTALLLALLEAEGTRILDLLDLDVAFNIADPGVRAWLAWYVPQFSEALEEVNVTRLRSELTEGMAAGESIPQLMARVNETFESFDKYRAEVIARSETSRASNRAAIEGYKQSGVVTRKVWMTAPGCCDWCAELDGRVVALEENFYNLGDSVVSEDGRLMNVQYEDIESPPLHPNCRCAIAADID